MQRFHAVRRADGEFFGTEPVWKILLRIAPPVMLAQLIQALYNVVDSFFVGRYSGDGQTARWKRELPPRASGQERAQGAAG